MQPANYTQMGRRRTNSYNDIKEDNQQIVARGNSEIHLTTPQPTPSSIQRSYSGSNLCSLYYTLNHIDNGDRLSASPPCSQYNNLNPADIDGQNSDRVYRNMLKVSRESQNKSKPNHSNTENQIEEKLLGQATEALRTIKCNQNEELPCERSSSRSGSWTGVNESDDEMEVLNYTSPSAFPVNNILAEGVGLTDGNIDGYSYQNSYAPSTVNSGGLPTLERMQRQLKFFFMNTLEKWHAKRRFPWKLLIQVFKIIIVTAQLCMFASQRYEHVSYLWDTKVSFSHLFIKGWDTTREINAYPPSNGPLALYKTGNFYDFLDYSIQTFANIEQEAIGSYHYNGTTMPTFCFSEYISTPSNESNDLFYVTSRTKSVCITIPDYIINNSTGWSIKEYLHSLSYTIDFDVLLDAALTFVLKSSKLKQSNEPYESAECYELEGTLFFNNRDHDGQMLVDLNVGAKIINCHGPVHIQYRGSSIMRKRLALNVTTIMICSLSFIMCMRAIYRAHLLKNTASIFFKCHFNRDLTRWEKFEFTNLWYVLICINDLLIVTGSLVKIGLEVEIESFDWAGNHHDSDGGFDYEGYLDKWNVCSLLLGVGNLLVWFGLLRYLGFFKTYNVLILTIKSCFPNVLRYSVCILIVFCGYAFCGWLIMGPYHLKFRSLSSSIECLYSLVNGDDMFATFSTISSNDSLIWWFSRIYLYSFISLFIYVILSLFIAIIMDSFETIKGYYARGFPCSELRQFATECEVSPQSGAFMDDDESSLSDIINAFLCCCRRSRNQSPDGYEELPS